MGDYDVSQSYWWNIVQESLKATGNIEQAIRYANTALHEFRVQYGNRTLQVGQLPVAPPQL